MSRMLLPLALVLLPAIAGAQAYKWKDANGQVHYSQTPPLGQQVEEVRPAPPPSSNPNQDSLNQSLSDSNKAAPDRERAAQQAADQAAQKQTACKQALEGIAYMDAHQGRSRMTTTDAQGKVARVTDQEFAARRAEMQASADKNCN